MHSAFLTKELDLANHQYVYGILVAIMFEANERHHLPRNKKDTHVNLYDAHLAPYTLHTNQGV